MITGHFFLLQSAVFFFFLVHLFFTFLLLFYSFHSFFLLFYSCLSAFIIIWRPHYGAPERVIAHRSKVLIEIVKLVRASLITAHFHLICAAIFFTLFNYLTRPFRCATFSFDLIGSSSNLRFT